MTNPKDGIYICLGSNSKNAKAMLSKARLATACLPGCSIIAKSKIYLTEPQNYKNQSWFFNQVMRIGSNFYQTPQNLLAALQSIETEFGRKRDKRFGPRTIDIDLIYFNGQTSEDDFCTLPHPRFSERAFVLVPLLEINHNMVVNKIPIKGYLDQLEYKLVGNLIYQP